MDAIILKIEATINTVLPFVVIVLSALHLTGVVPAVEMWTNIVLALLGVVAAVLKIWARNIKKARRI